VTGHVPPLLVIAGPTATGKTGLSIATALALMNDGIPAEVVSADSRQVYRGLDIGTAKVAVEDRAGVPHHGLDLAEPDESFTLADFAAHARGALARVAARGGVAILVGGTGLYLRAVARGIDTDALPSDPVLRAELESELVRDGLAPLVARLESAAPRRAARTDLKNPRRVVRALEIAASDGDTEPPPPRGYDGPVGWVGLDLDQVAHRRWIASRARAQFEAGLIEEARALRERFDPGLPPFSAIGYREAWAVIDGQVTTEEAITLDAQRNSAFARRQRTWFRSEPEIEWLDATNEEGARSRALAVANELVARAGSIKQQSCRPTTVRRR
jgi:tRNA dimethylallyltransferase